MQTQTHTGRLAVAVQWEAKPGEEAALLDIAQRFLPLARQEPGVQLMFIHRSESEPGKFLFYELWDDATAYAAHQQTPHFRSLILEQALPRLVRRDRAEYVPV